MQIAHSLENKLTDRSIVLTIGKFDGMHLGHQLLIGAAVERAKQLGLQSVVLTFEPHPDTVVRPERDLKLLTSLEERTDLIREHNADFLLIAPFTRETMATPAALYMRQIHEIAPLRELWVGDTFALGRRREGDIPNLIAIGHELGYPVGTVAQVLIDGLPISSTRVREVLRAGMVEAVVPLLGRKYWLDGPVVQGDQRGRKIGFPTANLAIASNHLLPADGVYACRVQRGDQQYNAVTNIGVRPTFAGLRHTVETHLLDFNDDLYGERLRLTFVERLRGEQKFNGIDELIAQIGRDVAQARALFTTP